jgi:lipopolysaccharide transport system permease protein
MISAQTARQAIWRPLWQLPSRSELILSLAKRETADSIQGIGVGDGLGRHHSGGDDYHLHFYFFRDFSARFGPGGTAWDYALYLFCGLLPWTMFQETVQTSSTTIVSHANLVMRVVFSARDFAAAQALSALANQMFGTIALLVACVVVRHELHVSILWLPALLIPQLIFTLGVAWLVASLGVFLRDIAQGITLVLMAWMYLTPIHLSETIVPERYRPFINANPFTALVRSYRQIFLEGLAPDWPSLAYFAILAAIVFLVGYWWFAKTRRNFADVI